MMSEEVAMSDARAVFRRLHEAGCFVMPNPWDAGSARFLASLGFPALATTSSGFAFSEGLPDGERGVSRERCLAHLVEMVRATPLPVNADFQAGFGASPEAVFESVALCVETGVAGLSIEDATGDASRPLFELAEAVERVAAAREAIDASGSGVVLTARAECFLVGHPDPLPEALLRLRAYAGAEPTSSTRRARGHRTGSRPSSPPSRRSR
jgi:2-methylisocitrate lyase-like PEP mutase family enzyme